jgi:putative transposase
MRTPACPSHAGHRFPAEIISRAVWLYFPFPLGLRMVEAMLAVRGLILSHESVRWWWAMKFGQAFAHRIRRRLPRAGDAGHLDAVALKTAGTKPWLWHAVDQDGIALDVPVHSRRDEGASKGLPRKLRAACRAPRVMITDQLASGGAARREITPGLEHRQYEGGPAGQRSRISRPDCESA